MGRPLKFKTVEDFVSRAKEYLDATPREEWTITGLADFLDTSRETLMNYEKRDGYFDAIKKYKQKIEMAYEISLRKHGRSGDIFALKNFGWKDKIESEMYGKGGKPFSVVLDASQTK